jgi:hypothetical protein
MWGGSVPLAYAMQTVTTVILAVALALLWRSRTDFALKAAALAIGTLLATRYSLEFDLMVLAPAIAFLGVFGLSQGFRPYEATLLAALWLAPLVARSVAQVTLIPLGVIAMLAMFVVIIRRALSETERPVRWRFVPRALK